MRLKVARQKRKLTQEQLEALAKVPQSVICKLETKPGVSCDVETDRKLTKALRVRPGSLEYGAPQSSERTSAA